MTLENKTVENNLIDIWNTAPKTDTELLRVLYNWRAFLDREAVEQLREKNSEIESLKAEIYRLKKTLSELNKDEAPAETEKEKEAFNLYNLYNWLAVEAMKEKPTLNLFIGKFTDYLDSLGIEENSFNIAKIRAIAGELPILCRKEAEESGIERTYNLLQDIRIGSDFITVKFNDNVYHTMINSKNL